ncbi:MAG: hypothetical protein JSS60_08665 [Verrucomicrobia bacterium]|nr:hypothetical protein [Verrucomicrobiota bacterium]
MRKLSISLFGIIACAATPLCADGFSASDRALLAGKDPGTLDFPGSEASLPEADMTDDATPNTTPAPGGKTERPFSPEVNSGNPGSGKDVSPEVQSGNPSTGKDIYNPEGSASNPSTGKDIYNPESNASKPSTGKDVIPRPTSSNAKPK